MNKVDPELVELFEYHFGIDLTESKYAESRAELAAYFAKVFEEADLEFHKSTILKPSNSGELKP